MVAARLTRLEMDACFLGGDAVEDAVGRCLEEVSRRESCWERRVAARVEGGCGWRKGSLRFHCAVRVDWIFSLMNEGMLLGVVSE